MRYLFALLILLLPMQALALSCVRPSVERSYQKVEAAKDTYVIATGRLTFDRALLPKGGKNDSPKMTRVLARLVGKSMSSSGFNVPFDHPVTLEVACLSAWCGGAEDGGDVLAFLRREKGQYALGLSPCGGLAFANPKPAMLKKVLNCHKGWRCKAN